jgi:hypothetical protein
MKDEQRIKVLEDELKILKSEVKSVLLDLREQYLNIQNPFNQNMVPSAGMTAVAGTNSGPEQKHEEKGGDEIEASAAANTGNMPIDVIMAASQMPASQLPKSQKEGNSNNSKTMTDGFQSMDVSGSETSNEEEIFEELLPNVASSFNRRKKEQKVAAESSKIDLVVIAGLTQWLDQATAKLGKERTEVLVEISFAMGRLPENLKDALIRMARLSHYESTNGQSITAGDYLAVLAQLENLLTGSQQQDNALLSILSMMKDSRNG